MTIEQAVSPVDSDQAVVITITTTCQAERSVTSQCEYYLDGFWTKHGNYEEYLCIFTHLSSIYNSERTHNFGIQN